MTKLQERIQKSVINKIAEKYIVSGKEEQQDDLERIGYGCVAYSNFAIYKNDTFYFLKYPDGGIDFPGRFVNTKL